MNLKNIILRERSQNKREHPGWISFYEVWEWPKLIYGLVFYSNNLILFTILIQIRIIFTFSGKGQGLKGSLRILQGGKNALYVNWFVSYMSIYLVNIHKLHT